MAIGTTIDGLNAVTSLTAQDEVPVWDAEASGEPTKKITASNMTASVKTLGSLVNTTEMNNALAGKQNTLTFDITPTTGSTNPVTSGGIATAISQSTAKYSVVTLGSYQHSTANAWENTGLTITVPTGHMYIGVLEGAWSSGKPTGIGINPSNSLTGGVPNQAHENNDDGALAFTVALYPSTWYVYTKRASAGSSANNYYFRRIDVVTA